MSGKAIYTRNPDYDDSLGAGNKSVTVAGTGEALAASTPCTWVTIQAKRTNTGRIYVGGSTVKNDDTAGIYLDAGDTANIDITNLIKVFIDATVTGEGVTYVYSK